MKRGVADIKLLRLLLIFEMGDIDSETINHILEQIGRTLGIMRYYQKNPFAYYARLKYNHKMHPQTQTGGHRSEINLIIFTENAINPVTSVSCFNRSLGRIDCNFLHTECFPRITML